MALSSLPRSSDRRLEFGLGRRLLRLDRTCRVFAQRLVVSVDLTFGAAWVLPEQVDMRLGELSPLHQVVLVALGFELRKPSIAIRTAQNAGDRGSQHDRHATQPPVTRSPAAMGAAVTRIVLR